MCAISPGARAATPAPACCPPTVSTKCHWYITPDEDAAQQFLDTKDTISQDKIILRAALNTPQETRPIPLPPGTRRREQ
ncbi:hypothetical protein SAMN04488069_11536 [Hymenobacter psychrophilus]|uniref:Uncharacterized protein n=1 Tax=Hymenobacter psychrophilus TaxID=651662 RepID=A0A1H3N4C1_9BACT|nr:hypothetical protein SAMN04488069_11536 [Hymenobacter psychrophilus]